MKNESTKSNSDALSRLIKATFAAGLLSVFLLLISAQSSDAGSATWNLNPTSGAWNTATNWTPNTVPNGPVDIATFGVSNTTSVSSSGNTVDRIVFNAGASAFTVSCTLGFFTFEGAGITNNSQTAQNFVASSFLPFGAGLFEFNNSATAGNATFTHRCDAGPCGGSMFSGTATAGDATFVNQAGASAGGYMSFGASSTAGNSTLIANGGSDSALGAGFIQFSTESSAGNCTMITNGATSSAAFGGSVEFSTNSTASSAIITANGGTVSSAPGGKTSFVSSSTAGQATLIANGGTNGGQGGIISFLEVSTGGTTRIEIFGTGTGAVTDGTLDITQCFRGVIVGSIEGNGAVFLGANNLTVGSNNLSTTFSGVIQDGGLNGGVGGSLTKTGKGKLTLSSANTYTGGTTISKGTLLVTNRTGSATGTGTVQVQAGILGGTGKISGAVTVASGTKAAILAPGSGSKPGKLTMLSTLVFNSHAEYRVDLNNQTAKADSIVAKGVTINSGAVFSIFDPGSGTLTTGTVFTMISNTAATPIAGTFRNVPDGSTINVHSDTFQVSYEGGDGNDLTLTVVP